MKVNFNSVGFSADQKLLDFIQKKLNKIETFYDKVIDADVYLKLDNNHQKENKILEIRLNVPGDSFLVKKEAKSFEEAMDECLTPLERFVIKHKETKN